MRTVVIAGIGTGVGKTVVSAIVVEALQADYWKPVQAGNLDKTDTDTVRELVSNSRPVFHPETFRLKMPASPHTAAGVEKIEIRSDALKVPSTANTLVIELAGGLMVPLNHFELNIDLVKRWKAGVILVSQNYLGSINHTLLSVNLLKSSNIVLEGIIFTGEPNASTEELILEYTGVKCLGHIGQLTNVDKATVKQCAALLEPELKKIS